MIWVMIAAAIEVLTGLVLIVRPSLFVSLLTGADLTQPGEILGRLAGFALLALSTACWPAGETDERSLPAIRGLLGFSLLSALYLIYIGIGGGFTGVLL
jgi:hypothetical protein